MENTPNMDRGGSPPPVAIVRSPARFSDTSVLEINRFASDGQGLAGISTENLDKQTRQKYVIQANLGPAFDSVPPLSSDVKDLEIMLVSLDGRWAIFGGNIHHQDPSAEGGLGDVRADFAFIANPADIEQEVSVLVSEPGTLTYLIDNLANRL